VPLGLPLEEGSPSARATLFEDSSSFWGMELRCLNPRQLSGTRTVLNGNKTLKANGFKPLFLGQL
jgi:hypothetical protein